MQIREALGAVATACLLVLLAASPTVAHAELVGVTPAGGEAVDVDAPLTVTLTFSEAIDPQFATVVVVDAAEVVIADSGTQVDGPTVSQVLPDTLQPGGYAIRYRVVSADGHPVDGESTFTVVQAAQPSATTPAPAPVEPTPVEPAPVEPSPVEPLAETGASAETEADGGGSGMAFAAGALALAGLVAGGAVVARRRRDGPRTDDE